MVPARALQQIKEIGAVRQLPRKTIPVERKGSGRGPWSGRRDAATKSEGGGGGEERREGSVHCVKLQARQEIEVILLIVVWRWLLPHDNRTRIRRRSDLWYTCMVNNGIWNRSTQAAAAGSES